MSRTNAVAVLIGFALLFCLVAYFGIRELSVFKDLLSRCETPSAIDYSSLWFGGFICFAILPLLTFTRDSVWHRAAFLAMIVLFFGVPAILHSSMLNSVEDAGYGIESDPGLFTLARVEFHKVECE